MSDVHRIVIQLKPPRGTFPGKVAIGYYCIADNAVVITDENGKPAGTKRQLSPGDDARLIACRLLRQRQTAASGSGFNDPIRYPKLKF
jgi:hypothetical protein